MMHQRYADALQLAADLAADLAELTDRYAECLSDLTRARINRDDNHAALLKTQAEVERLTYELAGARQGWAEQIRTNSHAVVIGPAQE